MEEKYVKVVSEDAKEVWVNNANEHEITIVKKDGDKWTMSGIFDSDIEITYYPGLDINDVLLPRPLKPEDLALITKGREVLGNTYADHEKNLCEMYEKVIKIARQNIPDKKASDELISSMKSLRYNLVMMINKIATGTK